MNSGSSHTHKTIFLKKEERGPGGPLVVLSRELDRPGTTLPHAMEQLLELCVERIHMVSILGDEGARSAHQGDEVCELIHVALMDDRVGEGKQGRERL